MRRLAGLLALAVLAACGPVPGGSLGGQPASAPADWSSALGGEKKFCEIEARPEDPHSIQLECFLWQGGLYVQSHRWAQAPWWPVKSWATVWIEHPEVRVRIGDTLYDLVAAPLEMGAQRSAILGQRGYDPVPEGIVLFRFDPRAPT